MAGYMKTYTGVKIDPLNPQPEDIVLEDIAHALSYNCRGNGQTKHFYSVAQHCINAQKEAKARGYSVRLQLACLLHDASEAYLTDLIRPVKIYMPKYDEIEDRFLKAVYVKFGLGTVSEEEWKLVKSVDDDLLTYDLVILLNEEMPETGYRCSRVPDLEYVPFQEVEKEYISIAKELLNELVI